MKGVNPYESHSVIHLCRSDVFRIDGNSERAVCLGASQMLFFSLRNRSQISNQEYFHLNKYFFVVKKF